MIYRNLNDCGCQVELSHVGHGVRFSAPPLVPGGYVITFEYLPVIITVLWFVLVVNTINFSDGLDGLAAGVVLFSALGLLVLAVLGGRFVVAMGKRGDSSRFFCSFGNKWE
jgi:UDP-N-acetylmuramyl pentapeptide phosphotransferase/UDP-N-acetylglucosamine-1-phosphate transferase